jgi:ribosomal protein L16 Arg81 hydroxylase
MAIDGSSFASQHWGTRPLLTRAEELHGDFGDLLDLTAVDELLSRRALRTPFVRMARDGTVLAAKGFTGSRSGIGPGDQVRDDRVLELFAEGATVVLQGLQHTWPPIADFAGELARDLGHPVQVNAYVTPPQSQGFAAHYDTHDVFVLQVAGEKRWRVHEPVRRHPLADEDWGEHRGEVEALVSERAPVIDTVLRPGDALYLPRGWIHSAVALGEVSAHLTVGILTLTRWDLVSGLVALADEDDELRRSLPMGLDLADPGSVETEVAATLHHLTAQLAQVKADRIAERLRARAWPAIRPGPVAPLAQAAVVAALEGRTPLAVRPGLRWLLHPGADTTVLELADKRISFPAWVGDAVRALLSGSATRASDVPGLDEHDQLVLVRRLLREAVLVPGRDG